jgi:IclR family KDG regulon transcriptional repressor
METTLVKGLHLLEAVVRAEKPCSLTELATACDLSKSNAHRLLRTLEECHYLRQDPASKAYEPTLRIWELGIRAFRRVDLRAVAAEHLRQLAGLTGESVHLSVLDDSEVLYIDKVESQHAVRAFIGIGDRAPAYCTATGKAMLAFMPPSVVEAAARTMQRFTPLTPIDHPKLHADLQRIRIQGYAVTAGEWRAGVLGIAAPIRSADEVVVGGVGIAGPEARMAQADFGTQLAAVLATAEAISDGLGLPRCEIAATATKRPRRPSVPVPAMRLAVDQPPAR